MCGIISEKLSNYLIEQFKLDINGIHGVTHWRRVSRNAHWIAEELRESPDLEVCDLFAYIHDSCRQTEVADAGHGDRAANLAFDLHGSYFDIGQDRLALLTEAITIHHEQMQHPDLTIKVCLDADRLDLGRIGVTPDRRFLNTTAARALIWKCVPKLMYKRA
jgi:uncharacterized protein